MTLCFAIKTLDRPEDQSLVPKLSQLRPTYNMKVNVSDIYRKLYLKLYFTKIAAYRIRRSFRRRRRRR